MLELIKEAICLGNVSPYISFATSLLEVSERRHQMAGWWDYCKDWSCDALGKQKNDPEWAGHLPVVHLAQPVLVCS